MKPNPTQIYAVSPAAHYTKLFVKQNLALNSERGSDWNPKPLPPQRSKPPGQLIPLTLQINRLREHLIRRPNGARVRLKSPLIGDDVDELIR